MRTDAVQTSGLAAEMLRVVPGKELGEGCAAPVMAPAKQTLNTVFVFQVFFVVKAKSSSDFSWLAETVTNVGLP